MAKLSEQDFEVIRSEEENLKSLIQSSSSGNSGSRDADLLMQIVELRDSLEEANPDDRPQILEQIDRITSILNQKQDLQLNSFQLSNPYFAHFAYQTNERTRDFFLGSSVYKSADGRVQIIDWKRSPISILYYRYRSGDSFDEEIGEREIEGDILFKRSLRIDQGELIRIQQDDQVFIKQEEGNWELMEYKPIRLKGGSGTSARAETLKDGNPKLGTTQHGRLRKDKHLPEIASLLDERQFDLITRPESGLVTIQGGAGSGKTTIALHRVAWLHYQKPEYFLPSKMTVFVFNKALANYISKVLPSLGVKGVPVRVFEEWTSYQRRRLYENRVPHSYSEETPVNTIRVKKHPAMIQIMDEFITSKETEFYSRLSSLLQKHADPGFALSTFDDKPVIKSIYFLKDLISNKNRSSKIQYTGDAQLTIRLEALIEEYLEGEKHPVETLTSWWNELFSSFDWIEERLKELATDLSTGVIEEAVSWIRSQYILRQDFFPSKGKDPTRKDPGLLSESDLKAVDKPMLDTEDDAILLYLYQKLLGDIKSRNKKTLKFRHLVIDETQDMCPLELKVLLNLTSHPQSVTMCGDTSQKMIQYNSFHSWKQVFDILGIDGHKIAPLKVSYRSTYQIMQFATDVLGEMGEDVDIVTQREGAPVELFFNPNQGESLFLLSENLKALMEKEPLASVAIITHDQEDARRYHELLQQYEVPSLRIVEDQEFAFKPGIDICEIFQVKGLEFDYVIMMDVDTVNYPLNTYSRYLVHIGATRAAHQLWIMNYRLPSQVLPEWLTKDARK